MPQPSAVLSLENWGIVGRGRCLGWRGVLQPQHISGVMVTVVTASCDHAEPLKPLPVPASVPNSGFKVKPGGKESWSSRNHTSAVSQCPQRELCPPLPFPCSQHPGQRDPVLLEMPPKAARPEANSSSPSSLCNLHHFGVSQV